MTLARIATLFVVTLLAGLAYRDTPAAFNTHDWTPSHSTPCDEETSLRGDAGDSGDSLASTGLDANATNLSQPLTAWPGFAGNRPRRPSAFLTSQALRAPPRIDSRR